MAEPDLRRDMGNHSHDDGNGDGDRHPQRRSPRALLPLLGLWLGSGLVDRGWLLLDNRMPAWDQADYLNGAINYWALWNQTGIFSAAIAGQNLARFSPDWWTQFWQLAPKIPPLTYLATLPFFQWFSPSADAALGVQLLFSALLLISVYGLARCIFQPPRNHRIGLWAAAICVLLPGLARLRLDYLLDYPLTASVAAAWWMLSLWQGSRGWRSWPWAGAAGLALGLAILVKQTALLFLLTPLLWIGITALGRWGRLLQGLVAVAVAGLTLWPWVAPNWLLILTSSKRATVDSALKEGDPSLLSPEAWLYYLQQWPDQVGWLLLLTALLGLGLGLVTYGRQRRRRSPPAPPQPPGPNCILTRSHRATSLRLHSHHSPYLPTSPPPHL
ncbi:MAG: DUF2029 domain-containing protein, partial [Synechococcales cyanobacterium RM1_1_8]|nr:DUF2029 domain-containing protein [Synechococcales cyanobacterium RM1_1_8]